VKQSTWYDDARPALGVKLVGADAERELSVQDVPDFIGFVVAMNPWHASRVEGQPP